MEADPIDGALVGREELSKWLWRIHNRVNDKLRSQGFLSEGDPSFESVRKVYEERIAAGCTRTAFEGWEFLFSVAENHPFTRHGTSPMPGFLGEGQGTGKGQSKGKGTGQGQSQRQSQGPEFRNRWNIMEAKERMGFYTRFWKSVGPSLPFPEWRAAWEGCEPRWIRMKKRPSWLRELWRIRCCLEKQLELVNRDEFENLCKRLQTHRSGCGKKTRARTCRKVRKNFTRKRQGARTKKSGLI
jgi:hypothetical protein